jgi:Tfp pilus assembly protein PilP
MKYFLAILTLAVLSACVQTPTERTEVVDDRPRLAFEVVRLSAPTDQYDVYIDQLRHGTLSQFLVDENTLRVTDGRHLIEVKQGNVTVFSQDVYLGANNTRVIKVQEHD